MAYGPGLLLVDGRLEGAENVVQTDARILVQGAGDHATGHVAHSILDVGIGLARHFGGCLIAACRENGITMRCEQ